MLPLFGHALSPYGNGGGRAGLKREKEGNYNMRMKMKPIALLLAMVLVFAMAGCASKTGSKELKVGMECAYAPFNWTQSDDANGAVPIQGGGFANGYDVQIAKKIAADMGLELVIVKTEWDGLEPALGSGTIDAIIAGMSPTADRKTRIDFSDNYYSSDLVVVVKKGGAFENAKTLQDFAGAKITGQLNTFHYSVIDQLEGVDKQTALADFPLMITALSSGVIDGYISERPGAISAMVSNPDLTFIEFADGEGFEASEEDVAIAVGLKKNSPLAKGINAAIAKISEDDRVALMQEALDIQPVVAG